MTALRTDPAPLDAALIIEIEQLVKEVLAASIAYRAAKRRYATRQASLIRRYPDPGHLLTRTRDDARLAQAGADCGWHGADLERVSAALAALSLAAERLVTR